MDGLRLFADDGPTAAAEGDNNNNHVVHQENLPVGDNGAGPSSLTEVIWAAGLYTEATDLQPSRLLFTVMADLPREVAMELPSRMVVKDYRLRGDIPVAQMRGDPIIMRLPHNASNTQRKVVDRLLGAHMAVIAPLEDRNFIISPEKVQDKVVLIGVLADPPSSSSSSE